MRRILAAFAVGLVIATLPAAASRARTRVFTVPGLTILLPKGWIVCDRFGPPSRSAYRADPAVRRTCDKGSIISAGFDAMKLGPLNGEAHVGVLFSEGPGYDAKRIRNRDRTLLAELRSVCLRKRRTCNFRFDTLGHRPAVVDRIGPNRDAQLRMAITEFWYVPYRNGQAAFAFHVMSPAQESDLVRIKNSMVFE